MPRSARRRRNRTEAGDAPRENWTSAFPPIRVLSEAVRAVPPVKYALGVAGIVAVLAIVTAMGVDLRVAALGAPILFVLMVVLVIFRRVTSAARANLHLPAMVFIWTSLILILAAAVLTATSVFFKFPMDLQRIILGGQVEPTPDEGDEQPRREIDSALALASSGDYAAGWKLLASAVQAKPRSAALKQAQANIAMMWLRNIVVEGDHTFAEYVDPLLPCLIERAQIATGSDAADAFAHIGWAYYLKSRESHADLAVEEQFRRSLEIDKGNVFAHVMWGFWIIWESGPLEEADRHFAAALQSGRERAFVRQLQLSALEGMRGDTEGDRAVSLIRALDEMRRNGETLSAEERDRVVSSIYFGKWQIIVDRLNEILPPVEHLATFRWLIAGTGESDSAIRGFWLARLTEAIGDHANAMELYLAVSSTLLFGAEIENGIQRCSQHGSDVVAVVVKGMQDAKPERRAAAAAAAGTLGPKAKNALSALQAAVRDSDAKVRANAAASISRIEAEPKHVVPSLIAALKDSDRDVRNAAGDALLDVGGPAAVDLASMLSEPLQRDRLNSANLLEEIGAPAAAATPALLKALSDDDAKVRAAVVGALGSIGGDYETLGPPLLAVLERDADVQVRVSAASSLGKLGANAKDAVPAIAEALAETLSDENDSNGFHGQTIAEALGEIGPAAAQAVPVLIEALGSEHMRVPTAAAEALGRIGAPARTAIVPLANALAHEGRDYVNIQAEPLSRIAQALAEAGDRQALPDLKRALQAMRERPEVDRQWIDVMQDAINVLAQ